MNKPSLGNGFGINRKAGGATALPLAVPPYGRTTVNPGLGKITPGSPKTGIGKPKRRH